MDPMSKAFVADIHHFIDAHSLELVHFGKGLRKDEVTQRLLAGFTASEGVLYVGRAQEKSNVWRTQRRHHADGSSYAWLVRASAFINFFYFYCVDDDFGPFFLKFSTYFPFTAKLCINGNEWAKRQAAKAGISFEPLDNGFAACGDVPALQAVCDSLGPAHIEALLRKWLKILPNPRGGCAQPVPLIVMAQQHLRHRQAGQFGVGHLRPLPRPGPGKTQLGNDAVGQLHIECGQKGVQVGGHGDLQGQTCGNTPILDTLRPSRKRRRIPGQRSS